MTIDRVIEILERKSTIPEEGETFEEISQAFDVAVSLLKEHVSVIHCADCDEWSHSSEHVFRDGDEGYCCVHHCITGKDYYCGDAENKERSEK